MKNVKIILITCTIIILVIFSTIIISAEKIATNDKQYQISSYFDDRVSAYKKVKNKECFDITFGKEVVVKFHDKGKYCDKDNKFFNKYFPYESEEVKRAVNG